MAVIHWAPCNLSDDPAVNEKYRDDVTALVDALYEGDDLHYEVASDGDDTAFALYCSERRYQGTSGFYRSPSLPMITTLDSDDGVFRSLEFKYYLVDYYSDDHKIVADLAQGVLDDNAVTHIFQELLYRIVENTDEYSIEGGA